MKRRREEMRTISEQAAEWLVVLSEGGPTKHAAFLVWLKQSPRHVEEFLLATTTWKQLCELGARQPIDVDAIVAEVLAPGAPSNVVTLEREPGVVADSHTVSCATPATSSRKVSGVSRRMQFAAGFAALALAAVLGWWALGLGSTYSTDVGEQRTVRLADGSVIHLNTDSRARVRFSQSSREVQLVEGEALFVVAHDGRRPFRVRTDDAVVQAIGTQFNVLRWSGDTRVAVIEGRVKVAHRASALTVPPTVQSQVSVTSTPQQDVGTITGATKEPIAKVELLGAGEEATIASSGRIVKRKTADVAQAIAWRDRRLVFRAERLEDVVIQINRYSNRHFRIESERARDVRLTATFDADKPESLATFLQQYGHLSVEARDGGFVIREQ